MGIGMGGGARGARGAVAPPSQFLHCVYIGTMISVYGTRQFMYSVLFVQQQVANEAIIVF